jgi:glycine cleavage system H protein
MIPEDLHYSDDHEWVRETTPGTVRIGITDYAQEQLGDVIQVQLPQIGTKLAAGAAYGEVESTKSVSDLVAPISEEVLAVNDDLVDQPELVNAEPYGNGWRLQAGDSTRGAPRPGAGAPARRRELPLSRPDRQVS